MPDLSMCDRSHCPKRSECYRYRAVPNELYQAYGAIPDACATDHADFMPIYGRPVLDTQIVDDKYRKRA